MKSFWEWLKKLFSNIQVPVEPIKAPEKPEKSVEPRWLTIARGELGVKEVPGSADNPRVLEYHKETSLQASDDSVAWCSSFANWCMDKANITGSRKANARSWLNWGKKLDKPRLGAVTVFWRGSRDGWQGHVAFFISEDKTHVTVLGGNQSDAVTIARYSKDQVLGYRWPT